MRNHYDILGIPRNATSEQIKTAYRKLSVKFHPDKNNGEEFFSDMFKQINDAYIVLYDMSSRKAYDLQLYRFEHPEPVIQKQYWQQPAAAPKANYFNHQYRPKDKWLSVKKWQKRRNVMIAINGLLILFIFVILKKDNRNVDLPVKDSVSHKPKRIAHRHKPEHQINKHLKGFIENDVDTTATKPVSIIPGPISDKMPDSANVISSKTPSSKDTVVVSTKKRKRGFLSRLFGKRKKDST